MEMPSSLVRLVEWVSRARGQFCWFHTMLLPDTCLLSCDSTVVL